MARKDFEVLADAFLQNVEESDKNKQPWQTKNHMYVLHNSLNEFYI